MDKNQKELELLSAYIDGELDRDELNQVNTFLASSSEARLELEKLLQSKSLVRSLQSHPAPQDLLDSLEAQAKEIMEEKESPKIISYRPRVFAWTGSFAAAAGLLIAVWLGINKSPEPIPLNFLLEAHAQVSPDAPVSDYILGASSYLSPKGNSNANS